MDTKYFKRSEFRCKCGNCHCDTLDYELLCVLQQLRERFLVPVIIASGNRCLEYNRSIGSKDTSQHVQGRAADIVVQGVSPDLVYETLCEWYPRKYGIGKYKTFTHIDTRTDGPARW